MRTHARASENENHTCDLLMIIAYEHWLLKQFDTTTRPSRNSTSTRRVLVEETTAMAYYGV